MDVTDVQFVIDGYQAHVRIPTTVTRPWRTQAVDRVTHQRMPNSVLFPYLHFKGVLELVATPLDKLLRKHSHLRLQQMRLCWETHRDFRFVLIPGLLP